MGRMCAVHTKSPVSLDKLVLLVPSHHVMAHDHLRCVGIWHDSWTISQGDHRHTQFVQARLPGEDRFKATQGRGNRWSIFLIELCALKRALLVCWHGDSDTRSFHLVGIWFRFCVVTAGIKVTFDRELVAIWPLNPGKVWSSSATCLVVLGSLALSAWS